MDFKKHILILGAIAANCVCATSEGDKPSLRTSAVDLPGATFAGKTPRRLTEGGSYHTEITPELKAEILRRTGVFMPELSRWNETNFEEILQEKPALEGELRFLLKNINELIPASTTLTTLNFETASSTIYLLTSSKELECVCMRVDLCPSLQTKLSVKRKVKPKLSITPSEAKNIRIILAYLSSELYSTNEAINPEHATATLALARLFEKKARGETVLEPTTKPVYLGKRK